MQLLLSLEGGSSVPLYKKMANAISTAIQEGTLKPGQVMPSSRELAASMSVSRLTARRCYEELTSQGYIKAHSRGKTYVRRDITTRGKQNNQEYYEKSLPKSDFAKRLIREEETMPAAMLASYEQACTPREMLPYSRFQECLSEAVRSINSTEIFAGQDVFGLPALREELQKLFARTRGINCNSEQIIVLPTTEGGLDLVCRLLICNGDVVATEDPGNNSIRRSLRVHGAEVIPIPLDAEGIDLHSIQKLEAAPKLVYVTPSHQDSSGITMSQSRRSQLLAWAAQNETLILEDDFESEFRYGAGPQAAIFSMDKSGSVIYRTNFWSSLYPLVKIGVLIIPQHLTTLFRNVLSTVQSDTPQLEQLALASFIKRGHYERYLHKAWKVYARRRAALVHALTKNFGAYIKINYQTSGTELNARFDRSFEPDSIEKSAFRAGLLLRSTKLDYADTAYPGNEYRVSFSQIDEHMIEEQVKQLRQLLNEKNPDMQTQIENLHITDVETDSGKQRDLFVSNTGQPHLHVAREAI